MFAKVNTAGLIGVNGFFSEIEADTQNGLPGLYLTGALAPETREAQLRVWNALKNSGVHIDPKKITVNFSPAGIRKQGTHFDLAIAAAILLSMGSVPKTDVSKFGFLGEIGLDGSLKPIRGMLPLCLTLKENHISTVIVPRGNVKEAYIAGGVKIIGLNNLSELIELFIKQNFSEHETSSRHGNSSHTTGGIFPLDDHSKTYDSVYTVDYADVHGQENLKRAAEIAVSGCHNILFTGPAGTGKTMIAKRMPTIMPCLSRDEDIEISKIYSICGLLPNDSPLLSKRPFRSPHHGITEAAFAGGGANLMPGELSLASGGILFLDEFPLFSRNVLEMLRQPLEERKITITRMLGSCSFPADFILAAAMNPCACGFYPDRAKCSCTKAQIKAYTGRLSKPLLDRIDIYAKARPVSFSELENVSSEESSAKIRRRVERTHMIQRERFKGTKIIYNSQMGISEIEKFCVLGSHEKNMAMELFKKRELSMRTYHKILKVARTIADMDCSEKIRLTDLIEASSFRDTHLA